MNTETEEWVPIKGYEGKYEVSDLGNVRSLDRVSKHPTKNGFVPSKGSIIIPRADKGGYLYVGLWQNGKSKTRRVHQLCAIAFLNHTPCGHKIVVNHRDFNRQNNRKDNLALVTVRVNTDQKHLPSSSKFVGVFWSTRNKRWIAHIWINANKAQKYLGSFTDENKASEAYQKALSEL